MIVFLSGCKKNSKKVHFENDYENDYSEEYIFEEVNDTALREKTNIPLYERLNSINFVGILDNLGIYFKADKIEDSLSSSDEINSLNIDFSNLKLYKTKSTGFVIINDTLLSFVARNGKKIEIPLEPPTNKRDSTIHLGFLKEDNIFIIARGVSEGGVRYESYSIIDGSKIQGIPLWFNENKRYYAFVQFYQLIGSLDLIINIWEKIKDGNFISMYRKIILLADSYKSKNDLGYSISKFKWRDNTFSFVLKEFKDDNTIDASKIEISIDIEELNSLY